MRRILIDGMGAMQKASGPIRLSPSSILPAIAKAANMRESSGINMLPRMYCRDMARLLILLPTVARQGGSIRVIAMVPRFTIAL
jgi:hypothetical protein